MRAQPREQTCELAARKLGVELRHVAAQTLKQLRSDDRAQDVRREIAERSDCPVNVLQYALRIVRRFDPYTLLHSGAPCRWQIAYRELPAQEFLLKLVAQHDVQRIGELVGVNSNQAAPHARQMRIDILSLPL